LAGNWEKLITVDSNHSEVCKSEGDDGKYEPVKSAIGELADAAVEFKKSHAKVPKSAGSATDGRT